MRPSLTVAQRFNAWFYERKEDPVPPGTKETFASILPSLTGRKNGHTFTQPRKAFGVCYLQFAYSLLASATLYRLATTGLLLATGDHTFRKLGHGRALELSGGAACRFLSPVDGIAKHFCYSGGATEKMNLKTMSLFFRTRLCIDATNVCFGLRIRPAAHNDENKLQESENQRTVG
jgi:hypothetical protein